MSQQNDIYIYDLDSEAIKSRVTLEKKQMGYIFIGTDALRDIFWLYEEGTDDDPDYLVGVDAEGNVRRIRLRPAISKSEFMLSTFLFFDRLNAWGETHTVIAGLFDGTVGRPLPVLLPDGRMMWREGRSLKIGHAEDESLAAETTVDTDYLFERCYLSKDEKKALLIDPGLTALLNAAEDEETTGEEMNALLQSPLNPVMVLVDTTDGTQTLLQNTFYSEPVLGVFSENGRRVAVTDGQKAVIYDEEGKPVAHLSENGHEVINISAYKDELLVLYSEGLLARYDWQSGAGTGRSRVSYYHSSSDQLIEQGHFSRLVSWNFTDGKLYLQSLGSGDLLQVIDLGSWEEELASAMIKAYDPVRDRMIAMDNDEQTGDRHLGWFPHYTVEDLRRKALEALHGEELSDEERKLFGLD